MHFLLNDLLAASDAVTKHALCFNLERLFARHKNLLWIKAIQRARFFGKFVLLAQYRLIAVLKKLAAAPMSAIKSHGITGQQPAHDRGKGSVSAAQQQVKMVRYQGPGKTSRVGFRQHLAQPCQKITPIDVVLEYFPAFDTSYILLGKIRNIRRIFICKIGFYQSVEKVCVRY